MAMGSFLGFENTFEGLERVSRCFLGETADVLSSLVGVSDGLLLGPWPCRSRLSDSLGKQTLESTSHVSPSKERTGLDRFDRLESDRLAGCELGCRR